MKDKRPIELAVGIFVITAVLIVMFLIIKMGERLFLREYELTAYFENAAGLSPGVTVTLAGVPIGAVKTIKLLTPEEITKLGRKGTLVKVVLEIEQEYGIPIDSELALARTAILGEQTLTFCETKTMKYLPKDGSAVVWNTSLPPGPTERATAIFEELRDDFGSLIENINLLLGDEQFRRDVKDTAANAAAAADAAKLLADDARRTVRSADQLLASAQDVVRHVGDSIEEGRGFAGTLLNDEEFNSRMKALVKALTRTTAELQDAILRGSAAVDEFRRVSGFIRRYPSSLVWGKGGASTTYVPPPVGQK